MAVLVGYIRVSGDSQEDNNSLPLQREAIARYCTRHGHTLFNIFQDVESGATIQERESFQFALDVIFADLADGLIVNRLDRFSRSFIDAEFLKEKLKERGKALVSITDAVDITTPDGELFFQMKSAFAELERKSINDRCEAGRRRKQANNGYYGGGPPYGWIALQGTLVPYEPEQQVISKIFHLKDRGVSLAKIAGMLNAEGVETKRGQPWKRAQVWAVAQGTPAVVARLQDKAV